MRTTHSEFNVWFVYTGLAMALGPGFGVAIGLSAHLAFGWSMGKWWPVAVQIHGHAQVFGWLGLFILGVSLFFLPRFSGLPLRWPKWPRWICLLLAIGILLRSLGQFFLVGAPTVWASALLGLAGLLEIAAIGLYITLIFLSIRRVEPNHPAIHQVRPYLVGTLLGWTLSTLLVVGLALHAAWHGSAITDPGWNRFAIDLFVGLVLLPVAFAFSIRTLPLYLRLPVARWRTRLFALLYFSAFALETTPGALSLAGFSLGAELSPAHAIGRIVKGVLLVALIWKLDLLTRCQLPWNAEHSEMPAAAPRVHPTPRSHLPDYGEFGRFEWPIYASYSFLLFAGLLEIYSAVALLLGTFAPFDSNALRHIYLSGFGTLLLIGMAPRLIPGFLRIRRLAHPQLVSLSFYLATSAALFRILPYLLPFPSVTLPLFGLSGTLGYLAITALAINLCMTFQRHPPFLRPPTMPN